MIIPLTAAKNISAIKVITKADSTMIIQALFDNEASFTAGETRVDDLKSV